MEDTPRGQRTSVSKKSTGREDGGPPTGTTAHISSDNNSGAKTLIKYDIDESLEIKEEIIQDEQIKRESNNSNQSDYNSGAKTLITYDIDESLDIKEEIIEDPTDEKCITTEISSDNNSGVKTLIEYDIDESLDIKEEIVQDQEINQRGHYSGSKTLIEYDHDETLEIKEEIIQAQENIDQRLIKKYESKLCTSVQREAHLLTAKRMQTSKKTKFQESKQELEKKYKCEKCARSYGSRKNLYTHKKFECGVKPQFSCEFCGKLFKRKSNMNTHILRVHQKKNFQASETRHNCDKCSRSYRWPSALNEHKRAEHAAVKPQFICDFCGYQAKRKETLSQHIIARHLRKARVSIP